MGKINLPMAAVKAMCQDIDMEGLLLSDYPLKYILENCTSTADWAIAARNCQNEEDVLPIAIHTFLMDWREE
jgi:hypothetical protein